jgi:hypothetical protein
MFQGKRKTVRKKLAVTLAVYCFWIVTSTTYKVGPSQKYSSIRAALDQLRPGDLIWIYARPQPNYEKFVINNKGTSALPIVIRGVPDDNGNLPIIDGRSAITPRMLEHGNETRSLLKI